MGSKTTHFVDCDGCDTSVQIDDPNDNLPDGWMQADYTLFPLKRGRQPKRDFELCPTCATDLLTKIGKMINGRSSDEADDKEAAPA